MTREEIMELLYDGPEVYRPPLENQSALLQITDWIHKYIPCVEEISMYGPTHRWSRWSVRAPSTR